MSEPDDEGDPFAEDPLFEEEAELVSPLPADPPASTLAVAPRAVPAPDVRVPVEVQISDLIPHPRNYRGHPKDQIRHLVESMRQNGVYRNVVVARDGRTLLAGHGVTQAAKEAGLALILAVVLDLDPNEPRALKVVAADNEIGNLAEVDDRALTELLKEVKDGDAAGLLGTGLDEAMLANLVMITRPASEIADINEAAEWLGMPEYDEGEKSQIKLVVSFVNEADRAEFVAKTGITVDKKGHLTWSTRWPFTERVDVDSVKFKEGDAPA